MAKGKIATVLVILIVGVIAGYFFYHDYAQGSVTLSITDPPGGNGGNPHYNSTILHIYITFVGIEIHQAGIGSTNDTGWHSIVGPPTMVDMLTILNNSRTLASTNLATGSYDQLRFTVSTAVVDFSTVGNVTYTVPSGSLKVSIVGGGFQSSPGTQTRLLLTVSFNDAEILAMNGHLTPQATATVS